MNSIRKETIFVIMLTTASIAAIVAAWGMESAIGVFLMLAGIAWGVWAAFLTLDQVQTRTQDLSDYRASTTTRTEAVRKLEIIARLSPEQIKGLGAYLPMIDAIGGSHGPVMQLRTLNDKHVQLDFAFKFLELSTPDELLPIRDCATRLRTFANAREQGELLTEYFIFHGLAEPGAGPNPAYWTPGGYELAQQWTGYGSVTLGRRGDTQTSNVRVNRRMTNEAINE